jgi:hypothetical protein
MRASTFLPFTISLAIAHVLPRASLWQPAVGAKIQMMITGYPNLSQPLQPSGVGIWDMDLFDTPASTISTMKSHGIKVICYYSAGTAENWRPDYKDFTAADLGAALPDWQGENYVDVRSENVLNIMKKRIQMASEKGCDALDPDNMGKLSSIFLLTVILILMQDE